MSYSPSTTAPEGKWWRKLANRMKYEDTSEWLKDMRGSLTLTVSIIATITFQSALNPPGGVVAVDFTDFEKFNDISQRCHSNETLLCPGQAVLAYRYPGGYHAFLVCNTISFIASLLVCLFLVSGLYLYHAFTTWLLLLCMWISITSLTLSYLFGAAIVTPFVVHVTTSVFGKVVLAWVLLLAVLGFLFLVGFVAWVWNTPKAGNGSSAKTIKEMASISGT